MKKIGLFLSVCALIWMGISALHLTNPYLRSADFIEVQVSRGENVWSIARRYATRETMAEQLEEAIIEVNGLAPDGSVAAGRRLRVPVIEPAEQLQAMAEPGSFHKIREIEPVLTGRFCAWYFPTKGGKYHVQNLFYS